MNLALMSHDRRKELMVQFCIAYCGILSKHTVCATNTTGKLVAEATSLPVVRYIRKLCDQYNIPLATNVATAEMLILGLERGDLDWRDIVSPKTAPFRV